MAGLVPAIHALKCAKTWMRGPSPRMTENGEALQGRRVGPPNANGRLAEPAVVVRGA